MIGYNCKYAPLEIFSGFGEEFKLINLDADNLDYAADMMHPNMCSHAKAMFQDIHGGEYDSLVFMNCCDSSKKVFDMAKNENVCFLHNMDLPSCENACAVEKMKDDLIEFIADYEKYSKKKFDKNLFLKSFENFSFAPQSSFVAILGARCPQSLMNAAQDTFKGMQVVDLTCASCREISPIDVDYDDSIDTIMMKYAKALMNQMPCMRMDDISRRRELSENPNCIGILYNAVKFCDYYDFEFARLQNIDKPIMRIETDCTNQSYGQILTRLEGFRETLKHENDRGIEKEMKGKYFAGIDSGSTSTELVIIDRECNIVKSVMVRTGANASMGAQNALKKSDIALEDIEYIVATGYGRKNIDFADDDVTEITCHAKGAKNLYDEVKTIIDIGGQDSKVINLDENGKVTGFVMNDKCAAGTGRFLENMAKVLELDMDKMAKIGLKYKDDITISSMCTVFAESEVVSLIAENHAASDIVHGLNKSVAVKTKKLAGNWTEKKSVMMTGGVANNVGVVTEIEKLLETKVYIPDMPEFCGALGAALIAAEKYACKL